MHVRAAFQDVRERSDAPSPLPKPPIPPFPQLSPKLLVERFLFLAIRTTICKEPVKTPERTESAITLEAIVYIFRILLEYSSDF